MSRKLVMKLLRADSEGEVADIIRGDAGMNNPANWHPLDGRDTNNNIVSNQARTGGKAATELITNMVDAVLMKRCWEAIGNPKGKNTPQNMYEAVKKFFGNNAPDGKIIKSTEEWLKEYSEKNLVIGVTGGRGAGERPCYTFCDTGEGQHPEDFETTFLSLSTKNKSAIPFVQGKYNMGSSGVLTFCGQEWHKLIVSRRYDKTGEWGWTLIRKNTPAEGMPYAEYYAPDKKILSAGAGGIVPFVTSDKKEFGNFAMETGTAVKLYSYNTGKSASGFKETREAFNENLVETILPFRIYDFRHKPDKGRGGLRALGIDERPFYGMEFLLLRTHGEDGGTEDESKPEGAIDVGTSKSPALGTIKITAVRLKKETQWTKGTKTRVFHHVNGQVQHKNMRGFLTQCRLPALKDRVAIFVDASKLTDSAHSALWKGDRETIRSTDIGGKYESVVMDLIKNSSPLKELNHQISKEELDSATQEGSREIVAKLISQDEIFLLLLNGRVPDFPGVPGAQAPEKPPRNDLHYDPTYVRVVDRPSINIPVNKTGLIKCDTNAQDDFFTRPENRGSLLFSENKVAEKFDARYNLKNGQLLVFLKPENAQVGDTFQFKIRLASDSMYSSAGGGFVESEAVVSVAIVEKAAPREAPPTPRPPKPPAAGLPPHKLITKNGRVVGDKETLPWGETGFNDFNEKDGGYVTGADDTSVVFINYDNAFFQKYLQRQKREVDRKRIAEKYVLGMRIFMLGSENSLKQWGHESKEDLEDDCRRLFAKAAASVVLTLCDQLPSIFDKTDLDGDDGDES